MLSAALIEKTARILTENRRDLVRLALRDEGPPDRQAALANMISLIDYRYCDADEDRFRAALRSTIRPSLCAVLDGLDTLELAGMRLIRARVEPSEAAPMLSALEQIGDDLRAAYLRHLQHGDHRNWVLDSNVVEGIPEAMFIVQRDHGMEALNSAARLLLPEAGTSCHQLFFGRDTPCEACPLGRVMEHWERSRCGEGETRGPRISLNPLTSESAVACRAEALDRPRAAPDAMGARVLEHIGSGVLFVDQAGCVVFANTYTESLIGPGMAGRTIKDALPAIIVRGDGRQRQCPLRTPSGRDVLIGYRCVPCILDGTPGVIITLRDVTEMERMRADLDESKRLSEVGRMCAAIAHEIRNPLAGIKATIQSIENEAQRAGLGEPLTMIHGEVDRLAELLRSFFAFVRQAPPRRQWVRLPVLVGHAVSAAQPRLEGIEVRVIYGPLRPVWIDPDQIQQVILNLILNADDAASSGGKVEISAETGPTQVVLRVEDDGVGIQSEHRDRLFEAFFTTKPGGSGLGLAICQRIVTAHGGLITLEGMPGLGTRAEVTLPLIEPGELRP